jgi:hypothetical protein
MCVNVSRGKGEKKGSVLVLPCAESTITCRRSFLLFMYHGASCSLYNNENTQPHKTVFTFNAAREKRNTKEKYPSVIHLKVKKKKSTRKEKGEFETREMQLPKYYFTNFSPNRCEKTTSKTGSSVSLGKGKCSNFVFASTKPFSLSFAEVIGKGENSKETERWDTHTHTYIPHKWEKRSRLSCKDLRFPLFVFVRQCLFVCLFIRKEKK